MGRRGFRPSGVIHPMQRWRAVRILELAASGSGETLAELATNVEADGQRTGGVEIELAKAAIRVSLDAGTWREVRAEAAQKLREGWIPPGFRKG